MGLTQLAGLAGFLRARLAELLRAPQHAAQPEQRMVIVAATAPFATTAYARARLLRQLHACGLLTSHETEQVADVLGVAN